MTITSSKFALCLLLFVSFVWGAEFVLIDMTINQLPTNTLNTLRFLVAAMTLLPFYYFSKERRQTKAIVPLLACGIILGFLLFLGFYGQTEGMRFTSVSNAGFITGLNVPLVSLLGFLIFRNRTRWSGWLGIISATLGLYFLTMSETSQLNKGDALVLVCAFGFALHIIFTDKFIKNLPIISLCIVQFFAVAFFSFMAALLSGEPLFYLPGNEVVTWYQQIFTPLIVSTLLIAGVLGTAMAYWAQSACQQNLVPHKVALVFATEPVFAHGAAWLFLDEHLGFMGLLGAGLIILGMVISEMGDKKNNTASIMSVNPIR